MNKHILPLAFLALASSPLTSQAAPGADVAANACIKAFVSTYLPNHPIKAMKTTGFQHPVSLALWQPRKYTIALSARGVTSGDILAEARCIANNDGIVLVLDTPPDNIMARADFSLTLN